MRIRVIWIKFALFAITPKKGQLKKSLTKIRLGTDLWYCLLFKLVKIRRMDKCF
jgi:hypothetical protein